MGLFSFRNVLTFGAGAAAGYFLGSREGRKQAEEIARQAQEFWTDPKTQQQVHDVTSKVTSVVKEKSPALGEAAETAAGIVDSSTGYSSETAQSENTGTSADSDTASDSTSNSTSKTTKPSGGARANS
ncbi:YtxH domain-containing protein [Auritidibacter ignavus]|uniref:YtxH domain-containing protein n=1 Tax=Auritidibacter ignavus TaxID=678932 RepID=UPI00109CF5F6|nr:YtxH domain-containing protein [Auritidibacter ignavus]